MSKRLIIIGAGETANLAHEYFMNDSNYDVVAFAVHSDYRKEDYFKNLPLNYFIFANNLPILFK